MMHPAPSLTEDRISQVPALEVLQNLGYAYLTAAACGREAWTMPPAKILAADPMLLWENSATNPSIKLWTV